MISNNAWDLAREYFNTPRDGCYAAYRRDLLKRINGAGFQLTRRGDTNYLMCKIDNRKKWSIK
jgi:hypothetical protein